MPGKRKRDSQGGGGPAKKGKGDVGGAKARGIFIQVPREQQGPKTTSSQHLSNRPSHLSIQSYMVEGESTQKSR